MPEITTSNQQSARQLKDAAVPRELTAEQLSFRVTLDSSFGTTSEFTDREDFAGQERAQAALELGLGVTGGGYNIFVSGLGGAEKLQALQQWIARRVASSATPGDWVYVHNFKHPEAPCAIYLQPGQGSRLKTRMHNLVKTLKDELPKAFRQEAFDREKRQLREKYQRRAQELNSAFEKLAREKGFLLQGGPGGQIFFVPLIDGKPAAKGATDTQRLLAGELVYTGVERSPLCAVISQTPYRGQICPVVHEVFATMRDVYLVLDQLAEDPANVQTADGRPATKAAARARLARMVAADGDEFNHRDAVTVAESAADAQVAARHAAVRHEWPGGPQVGTMRILLRLEVRQIGGAALAHIQGRHMVASAWVVAVALGLLLVMVA